MATGFQIPFDFKFRKEITIESFYPGKNKNALTHLAQLSNIANAKVSDDRFLFFWGESGCGKSHLLQACCKQAHEAGKSVAYFSYRQLTELQPEMLDGLEQCDVVAIDNVDGVAGHDKWEQALFVYIRKWREAAGLLLFSASLTPADIPFKLQDLKTRISGWPVTYQLHTLSDPEKLLVLQDYANSRGLELNQEVGSYILNRFPRNLKSMLDLLEQVDVAAMSQQRRLTVPFLKTLDNIVPVPQTRHSRGNGNPGS